MPAPPSRPTGRILLAATVRTTGRTGVEMEALTAVAVAACAGVDMLKGADRRCSVAAARVAGKGGGRSGEWWAEGEAH
jgi:cyclic pyranopterin phosphate synthase